MKATTALVAMVVIGVLLQLNGFDTIAGSLLDKVSPFSNDFSSLIAVGTVGILAAGVLLLGQTVPARSLAILLIGLLSTPVEILTSPEIAMPYVLKMILGIIWVGLLIQATGGALGGDL